MRLTLLPDQPPEPPTIAAIFARLEDLPYELGSLGRAVLNAPGTTTDFVLWFAARLDDVVDDCRTYARPLKDQEAGAMADLATILRDAAPMFPHPPRVPLSAEEADRTILARRVIAAGLCTAGGS